MCFEVGLDPLHSIARCGTKMVLSGMPDFVYSTTSSSFTNKFRDNILPYDCMSSTSLLVDNWELTALQWKSLSGLISTWAKALSQMWISSRHPHLATETCHSHTCKNHSTPEKKEQKQQKTRLIPVKLPPKPNSQALRRPIRRYNNHQHATAIKDPHLSGTLRYFYHPI